MLENFPLITYTTSLSVTEVIDRIEKTLKEKQIMIFARISHSQAAKNAGLTMQDEELIIFGNPKAGTPLMLESPAVGIELPLKIIAWQEKQQTIVGFKNMKEMAADYHLTKSADAINLFRDFLQKIIESAIQ